MGGLGGQAEAGGLDPLSHISGSPFLHRSGLGRNGSAIISRGLGPTQPTHPPTRRLEAEHRVCWENRREFKLRPGPTRPGAEEGTGAGASWGRQPEPTSSQADPIPALGGDPGLGTLEPVDQDLPGLLVSGPAGAQMREWGQQREMMCHVSATQQG